MSPSIRAGLAAALAGAVAACILAVPLRAQEPEPVGEQRNFVALFLGGAFSEGDAVGVTGLEYGRILSSRYFAGMWLEAAFGGERDWTGGLIGTMPLGERLRGGAGIGLEGRNGITRGLARLEARYEVETRRGWIVSPLVAGDFTTKRVSVLIGANVGLRL